MEDPMIIHISLIDLALLLLPGLTLIIYFWMIDNRLHRQAEQRLQATIEALQRRPVIRVSGPGARVTRIPDGSILIEFTLSMN